MGIGTLALLHQDPRKGVCSGFTPAFGKEQSLTSLGRAKNAWRMHPSSLLKGKRKRLILSNVPSHFWQVAQDSGVSLRRQKLVQDTLEGLRELLHILHGKQNLLQDGQFPFSTARNLLYFWD